MKSGLVAIRGDERAGVFGVEGNRNARGEVNSVAGLPDFDAARQDALLRALHAAQAARVWSDSRLVIAVDAAEKIFPWRSKTQTASSPVTAAKACCEESVRRLG